MSLKVTSIFNIPGKPPIWNVWTHLNDTYGSVWSQLRFPTQSAPTRFSLLSAISGFHSSLPFLKMLKNQTQQIFLYFLDFVVIKIAFISILTYLGSLVYVCIYQCSSTTKYFLQLDEETLR